MTHFFFHEDKEKFKLNPMPTRHLDTNAVFSRTATKSNIPTMAKVHKSRQDSLEFVFCYSTIRDGLFFDFSRVSALLKVLT